MKDSTFANALIGTIVSMSEKVVCSDAMGDEGRGEADVDVEVDAD